MPHRKVAADSRPAAPDTFQHKISLWRRNESGVAEAMQSNPADACGSRVSAEGYARQVKRNWLPEANGKAMVK